MEENLERQAFGGSGFSFSLKGELSNGEQRLIRSAVGILILILIYVVLSNLLFGEIQKKIDEVSVQTQRVVQQEAAIAKDKTSVDEKTSEYTELVQSIQEKAAIDTESKRLKYSVPTLLQKIMYAIPVNVQITSITNSGRKVTITCQSDKYEPIGMFVAKLGVDGILQNVVSDISTKQSEVVVVTIEGELP